MNFSEPRFWKIFDSLIVRSQIVIERPRGSVHPHYPDMVYPLDYGYLSDTVSADGESIDVWIGTRISRRLDAVICTVDMDKRDAEMKLLIGCTAEDMAVINDFYNAWENTAGYLIRRVE